MKRLIFIKPETLAQYHEYSTDNSDSMTGWLHLKNITNKEALKIEHSMILLHVPTMINSTKACLQVIPSLTMQTF